MGPTVTNGSITISWTFNEPVTSSCTIVKPDGTDKWSCNNSWYGDSLKEGFYTLFIFGKDLEGNQADVGNYRFQIGKIVKNSLFTSNLWNSVYDNIFMLLYSNNYIKHLDLKMADFDPWFFPDVHRTIYDLMLLHHFFFNFRGFLIFVSYFFHNAKYFW